MYHVVSEYGTYVYEAFFFLVHALSLLFVFDVVVVADVDVDVWFCRFERYFWKIIAPHRLV